MSKDEFCEYCDFGPNGFDKCDKYEPANTKECKDSSIEGLRVVAKPKTITFFWSGREIKRDDYNEIKKWMDCGKRAGWNKYKTPNQSPFEKAIKKHKD